MTRPTPRSKVPSVAHVLVLCAAALTLGCRPSHPKRQELAQPPAAARQPDEPPRERLVTIGGAITETVFALGHGDSVVGVDTSSVFPPEATRLPKVGYQRTLSAEGVLALRPTRVLAAEEAGPPHALAQLRSAGVPVETIPGEPSLAGARAKLLAIADRLHEPTRGQRLAAQLDAEARQALRLSSVPGRRPRVLFLYARSAGAILVAGSDTAAAAMIELAGAENAAAALRGFKPYAAEALLAARPDIVLLTDRGADSLGGAGGVRQLPGLGARPGESALPVVTLDDLLLLGFGPRTGQAIAALRTRLAAAVPASAVAASRGGHP